MTADKEEMPELQRLVTIAGPFNGFMGMSEKTDVATIKLDSDGKPNTMIDAYKHLNDNKDNFPKNIDVLNIFGDTGKGSDGVVPVNSVRSLRYIVEQNAKSYTEQEVKNSKSQHSKLHQHNPLVNQVLYNFLK